MEFLSINLIMRYWRTLLARISRTAVTAGQRMNTADHWFDLIVAGVPVTVGNGDKHSSWNLIITTASKWPAKCCDPSETCSSAASHPLVLTP
jgi:hypothetical protein